MIGQSILHYKILEKLGEGGMGVVYKAEDAKLKREVAIKFLPRQIAASEEERERFKIEAQAAAALNHPNIATIHNIEEVDEEMFIVMEYIEGRELKEIVQSEIPNLQSAIDYATQIAEGLQAAHKKEIVHRDIKSSNIMVTDEGHVKIMDFGLAKVKGGAQITKVGTTLGTAGYMSPEQARGQETDHRTDIWAFGVVLYEMLSGQLPFRGDYEQAVIYSILNEEPTDLTKLRDDVPGKLTKIVDRALGKEADSRSQNIQELLAELKGIPTKPPAGGAMYGEKKIPSIAVLPFTNMSADPENEYFSDGLTEEVISDLARLSSLRVISRNSAMVLKGTRKDTSTLARELGVSHLVTGSVRRAGQALRVTADLVEAKTDIPIWSEKYSGTVEDVFGIQEQISHQIVSALEITLSDTEERQNAEHPIDDIVAYDCYLRARQVMYNWTPEAHRRALRLVDEAIGIVGDTPLLLATAGQIHWNSVNMNIVSAEEGLGLASDFANRALAIDPGYPLAIFVRGLVAGMRGQSEAALKDLYRAHQLRPGDANIMVELIRYSNVSGLRNHWKFVEEVIRIDPLTPIAHLCLSSYRWINGPRAEAAPPGRRAIEMAPPASMFQVIGAWQIAEAGFRKEAVEILGRAGDEMGNNVHGAHAHFLRCALEGNEEEALRHVTPEMEQAIRNEFSCRIMSDAYALLGRRDDALRWLRRSIDFGFIHHPCLANDAQFLVELRGDPEFQEIMADLKPRWEAVVEWEVRSSKGAAARAI
jgi:non-specific serine/threonine protein kinase